MADKFGNKTGGRKNNGQFQKGMKRPENAGRKKGTPNKRTVELLSKLEELDYDPLEKLIIIANDDKTSTELKTKINLELLSYIYPKRKAVAMDITKYVGRVSEMEQEVAENEIKESEVK